jgi:hypothetical protein
MSADPYFPNRHLPSIIPSVPSTIPPTVQPTPPVPPIPPPPDPPQSTIPLLHHHPPFGPSSSTSTSHIPAPAKWNSLFKAKPRNAGKHSPVCVPLIYDGHVLVPPDNVIKAGNEVWGEYLVGFFLDKPLSYMTVISHLKKIWKLKGSISVKSDGFLFLFNLSCDEDRRKIIESDPIIMRNKLFIVKQWDQTVGNSCSSIRSVPVWVKLHNLPLYAWSHLGINWLASRLGSFMCMDAQTEKLERIGYAKCMVEVTPNDELLNEFPVRLMDGSEQLVTVEYLWRPEICTSCKVFGHNTVDCLKVEMIKKGKADARQKASNEGLGKEIMTGKGSKNVKQKQEWKKVENKGAKIIMVAGNNKIADENQKKSVNEGHGVGNKLLNITTTSNMNDVNTIETLLGGVSVTNSFNVLMNENLAEDSYVDCNNIIGNEICENNSLLEEGEIQGDKHFTFQVSDIDPITRNNQAERQELECSKTNTQSIQPPHSLEPNTIMPLILNNSSQGITTHEKTRDSPDISMFDEAMYRHALETDILSLCMQEPLDKNNSQYTFSGELPGWKSIPTSPTKTQSPKLSSLDRDKTTKFKKQVKVKRSTEHRDSPATRSMKNIIHQALSYSK